MKQFGRLSLVFAMICLIFAVVTDSLRRERQALVVPTRPPKSVKDMTNSLCFKCDCSRSGTVKCTGNIGGALRAVLRVARFYQDIIYFKYTKGVSLQELAMCNNRMRNVKEIKVRFSEIDISCPLFEARLKTCKKKQNIMVTCDNNIALEVGTSPTPSPSPPQSATDDTTTAWWQAGDNFTVTVDPRQGKPLYFVFANDTSANNATDIIILKSADPRLIIIGVGIAILVFCCCCYCCCYYFRERNNRRRRRESGLTDSANHPLPRDRQGMGRFFPGGTPWGERRRVNEHIGSSESILSEDAPQTSSRYSTHREQPGAKKAKETDSSSSGSGSTPKDVATMLRVKPVFVRQPLRASSTLGLTTPLPPPPPGVRRRSTTPQPSVDDLASEDESTGGSPSKQD